MSTQTLLPEDDDEPELEEPLSCTFPNPFSYITVAEWWPKRQTTKDLISGLTVGCMAVPQAMSYATVAGLPAVYGLYNAAMGLWPYCFFGTSPHLISGPTAVMSILVGQLIPESIEIPDASLPDGNRHIDLICSGPPGSLTGPDSEGCNYRITVALSFSFLAALIQMILGFANLGRLVDLIGEPIIVGFTTGSAFLIASTQFSNILGIGKAKHGGAWGCKDGFLGEGFQGKVCNVIHELYEGKGSWQTMLLGAFCVFVLYLFKYQLRPRLSKKWSLLGNLGPITVMLIMIPWMAATGGHVFGGDIKLVGSVCTLHHPDSLFHPECLPSLRWPFTATDINATASNHTMLHGTGGHVFSIFSFTATSFSTLLGKAVAVALIGYMESMTIAKTVARTSSEETGIAVKIDPNKELVALGICNLVCSQMSGYPVTGSFSRTAVNADSGAQTQLAAMFAAMLVVSALLMLTPVLQFIPKLSLSAIVLIAILKLIKLHEALFLWHVKRRDFLVFSSVVVITVFLGVEAALAVGILESWLLLLSHNNRAHTMIVGQVSNGQSKDLGDAHGHHARQQTPSGYEIIDIVEQAASNRNLDTRDTNNTSLNGPTLPVVGGGGVTGTRIAVVKVFQDLSFASAATFREVITETVQVADPDVIVIDASQINDVDGSGFYTLVDVVSVLKTRQTKLLFAAMPLNSRRVIAKAVRFSERKGWDLRLYKDNGGGGSGGSGGAGTKSNQDATRCHVQFYASTKGALRAARVELATMEARSRENTLNSGKYLNSENVEYKTWKDLGLVEEE